MSQSFALPATRYLPTPPPTPPPPYAHQSTLAAVRAQRSEGRYPAQNDAWERLPRTSCWREAQDEMYDLDEASLCAALADLCRRGVAAVLCTLCGGN